MPSLLLIDLHLGKGSIAEPTHLPKPSFQSKDSNILVIPPKNSTKISPFRMDLHSGMSEWASLHKDILLLIAENIDFLEDFFNFSLVCKSWQSVSSISGKRSRTLPPRCPWVMLTDIAETNFPTNATSDLHFLDMLAEEVEKNEHIEGMNKRRFYSFSTSKTYEFELPEATRKKCLGVGNGWLMTIGYDLQIHLLHPFSRQQVGMPLLSFNDRFSQDLEPQVLVSIYVRKAVMSSNPYYNSSNEDCIVLAIYGQFQTLAFARPVDKVWTDIYPRNQCYRDVVYYKGKFYAINLLGVVVVCDIHDVKRPKTTPIARVPKELRKYDSMYLVESSGSLLVVVRLRKGPLYNNIVIFDDIDALEYNVNDNDMDDLDCDVNDIDTEDDVDDIEEDEPLVHYTFGFSIFKLEECCHGDSCIDAYPYRKGYIKKDEVDINIEDDEKFPSSYAYPYKLVPVNNLGDESLFVGDNASASLPCSDYVKANHIYFSDDEPVIYGSQPFGGGPDTGIYDVESRSVTLHYASKFTSYLTPPMWYI